MYLFSFLILPICFFIAGIGCIICSNKNPNKIVGYRTKNSLKSKEAWKFSNHRAGVLSLRMSVVMFLGNMMFYALGLQNDCLEGLTTLVMLIDLLEFFLTIFIVEDETIKKFKNLDIEK